jgi:hypothetical protein
VEPQSTVRKKTVESFELEIIYAHVLTGGDIVKLRELVDQLSIEEIEMLEEAAMAPRVQRFLRYLHCGGLFDSEP